jgi:Flp pilus assembly protein TadB
MKRLALLLTFLFLLPTVLALQDLQASGPAEIGVFVCAEGVSQFTVANTGDEVTQYFISQGGDASVFASLDFQSVQLSPGEAAILTNSFDTPCDTLGELPLVTTVYTARGVSKVLEQRVVAFKPNNAVTYLQSTSEAIDPCGSKKYDLTLFNPVNFTESYEFSAKAEGIAVQISPQSVSLVGGEIRNISLTATASDCTVSGSNDIPLTIVSKKVNLTQNITLPLDISDKGIPEIMLESASVTNYYRADEVSVQVKNTGNETVTYGVLATGASFLGVSDSEITLESDQVIDVTILINPADEVPPGEFETAFTLIVQDSGIEYSADMIIELKESNAVLDIYLDNPTAFRFVAIILILLLLVVLFFSRKLFSKESRESRATRRTERKADREDKRTMKKQAKIARSRENRKSAKALLKGEYYLVRREKVESRVTLPARILLWIAAILFIAALVVGVIFARDLFTNNLEITLGSGLVLLFIIFVISIFRLRSESYFQKRVEKYNKKEEKLVAKYQAKQDSLLQKKIARSVAAKKAADKAASKKEAAGKEHAKSPRARLLALLIAGVVVLVGLLAVGFLFPVLLPFIIAGMVAIVLIILILRPRKGVERTFQKSKSFMQTGWSKGLTDITFKVGKR